MLNPIDRRSMMALLGAAGAATLLPGSALADAIEGDVVLGDENAPVTVIEYASYTCPTAPISISIPGLSSRKPMWIPARCASSCARSISTATGFGPR